MPPTQRGTTSKNNGAPRGFFEGKLWTAADKMSGLCVNENATTLCSKGKKARSKFGRLVSC